MKKSIFEWNKFFKENPDPLGVKKTGYKEYTMEEVSQHNNPPSIWTVYKGDVYDITMYVDSHPGGVEILKPIYGKDMTELYDKNHSYIKIQNFIGPLKIGTIKNDKKNK